MKDLLDNLNRKTQDLEKRIQMLSVKLSQIIPELGENEDLSSAVASLQSNVGNINSEIQSIQSNITALNTNYGGLVTSNENLTSSVTLLEQKVESIPDDLSATLNEIKTYANRINTLESTCTQLDTDIENLELRMLSQLDNVSGNLSDTIIANRTLAYNYTDNSCNNLKSEITAKIDSLNNEIDNLNSEVESLSKQTNTTQSNIDNELYFIIHGTYVSPNDLTNLFNGNYTI